MAISAALTGIPDRPPVVDAIAAASARTGVDFGYLLATAERESSLDPAARSRTSSATGLYQFVRQTWLQTLLHHGAKHGYGAHAAAIEEVRPGHFAVSDPALEAEILALRTDPAAAAAMAAELAGDNARVLEARLGRPPGPGELYAAHVLGAGGAARLIRAAQETPETPAEGLFPEAAGANRGLFYEAGGAPRSAAALFDRLAGHGAPGPVAPPAADPLSDPAPPIEWAVAEAPQAPAFQGGVPATSRYGFARAPVELTPEVIAILAALDPVPESPRRRETVSL